jgi:hypothetical protein
MRTVDDRAPESAESPSLEAEAAAWRSRRIGNPDSVAGKIPVVRIRRRALMTARAPSVDRPSAAEPR